MNFVKEVDGRLLFKRRKELLEISAYGKGLRIRFTQNVKFGEKNWVLTEESGAADIVVGEKKAEIRNGKIKAVVTDFGKISFFNDKGELILKEFYRSWDFGTENFEDVDQIVMVRTPARRYVAVGGNLYRTTVSFEANKDEKIFGMGQYQNALLNLKGSSLELAQKNTQASVPFYISSLGYGFMWNNPSIGKAVFAENITEWTSEGCYQADYWITAEDTPAEILSDYTEISGRVPMMPDYAMGFWQCKLRYQTQEELLSVAREYHRRNIPVGVMVVDFFHWPQQGDWRFDEKYWPDVKSMTAELKAMDMKLMVSVWPTVDRNSVHYQEMYENDYLVRCDKGIAVTMDCFGFEQFIDVTNPDAREYLFDICKESYLDQGVELFWLDEAEPEYTNQDFDIYRYYDGPAVECANEYPMQYSKAYYEGMQKMGIENPINLVRCAWLGSQKYGALVWSGDVPSTFTQLKNQYAAGLNMGLAGVAWWTADIGGFHGGNIHDPAFWELLCRWFEFGCFLPVMRLHGDREPHDKKPLGTVGGGMVGSGADNEIWSYSPEVEKILTKYIGVRNLLKPYTKRTMEEAHLFGKPVIRTLFYEFPEDKECWEDHEEYLYGANILVSPVLYAGMRERKVYLPKGSDWVYASNGQTIRGGTTVKVKAEIDKIPVFFKEGTCKNLIGKI